MKEQRFSNLNDEKLKDYYRLCKGLNIAFFVVIFILIIISVILTLKRGFGVFTIFPLFFIALPIANLTVVQAIKKEMANRNLI